MLALVGRINALWVDILFVDMESPRQEQWIRQWLPELNVKLCLGIGETLDAIVSGVKRSPRIFRRLGLEWLYRLFVDPRRIRRQRVLPVYAFKVIKEKLYINK